MLTIWAAPLLNHPEHGSHVRCGSDALLEPLDVTHGLAVPTDPAPHAVQDVLNGVVPVEQFHMPGNAIQLFVKRRFRREFPGPEQPQRASEDPRGP